MLPDVHIDTLSEQMHYSAEVGVQILPDDLELADGRVVDINEFIVVELYKLWDYYLDFA